jgi:phage terminase large subunit-like protein
MMFEPARHTPSLVDGFESSIDNLLPVIELAWSVATPGFKFDDWQVELLRRVTELLPSGELRWRSCLISMGRQNGKSEIVGALGIWALLRKPGAYSVGVASTAEQARLVYDRVQRVIASNPALERRMSKLTETRGIKTLDGSRYEIKASNANTLQGIPVSVGIVDEVHLVDAKVWDALASGTGARPDTLLVGITTAGDENSELLNRLYANADKAIAGDLDRFGAWIWEASEAVVPDDDDELIGLLMEANPALQSGRIDPKLLLDDVRALPKDDIIRYRLNRFIQSGTKTFIPAELWQKCERPFGEAMPQGEFVFAIDRTPDWAHATVAVSVKVDDVIYTELVASINKPSLEQLIFVCGQLMSHNPRAIIVDGYTLRDLHKELKARGYPAETATLGDIVNASSMFYARLARKSLQHGGDPLLSIQIPRTVRKMVGEGFRVSRRDSAVEIDAVMATLLSTFGADTLREQPLQVF